MNFSDQSNMKQDCDSSRECFEMLQMILDGEATAQQKDQFLKVHLEQCMPCFKNYHLEIAIRELLKAKCTTLAPQELIDDIRRKVNQKLSQ